MLQHCPGARGRLTEQGRSAAKTPLLLWRMLPSLLCPRHELATMLHCHDCTLCEQGTAGPSAQHRGDAPHRTYSPTEVSARSAAMARLSMLAIGYLIFGVAIVASDGCDLTLCCVASHRGSVRLTTSCKMYSVGYIRSLPLNILCSSITLAGQAFVRSRLRASIAFCSSWKFSYSIPVDSASLPNRSIMEVTNSTIQRLPIKIAGHYFFCSSE